MSSSLSYRGGGGGGNLENYVDCGRSALEKFISRKY